MSPSFFRRVTQTGPSPPHPTLPCSREFCLCPVSNIPRQPCSPWSSADFAISGGQEALLFLSPFQGKLSTPSHPLTGGEDKRLEITSLALWAGVAKLPASPAGDERRGEKNEANPVPPPRAPGDGNTNLSNYTASEKRNPIPVTVIARSSVNSSVRERQIIVKSIMLKVPGPGRALAMEP